MIDQGSHIILISRHFSPAICGVGTYSQQLGMALIKMGYRVSFITATATAHFAGQPVFVCNRWPQDIPSRVTAARQQFGPAILLWQYTPASFSNRQLPFWWPSMMRRLRKQGLQQAIIFHEVALRNEGNGMQRFRSICQQWIARQAYELAKSSATSVPLYRQYFPQRPPVLIPVGANLLPAANSAVEPGPANALFCFTNRCSEAMLQALAAIKARGVQFQLHLAGRAAPAQQHKLKSWVAEMGIGHHSCFHGELPENELLEIMARAGIFLQHQPLAANGQGGVSAKNGVTASAMALGLAIITTAGDMTDRQFFRHGQNCWLLENAGALQWEAAIQALLDEPALGRRLGSAARASFLQHLTWASIAESVHVHLLQPV